MPRKTALVIGNSAYQDATLAQLQAPDADVRALSALLRHADVGQFDEVQPLVNATEATTRRAIAAFFARARPDDLLLLYFSGHGVLDDKGRLYLAATDTQRDLPQATAISAAFITDAMDSSPSRRQVLILDCCHSGAFARGARSGSEVKAVTAATFEGVGYGRAVLTATDATQYAWEGAAVMGTAENSVFTHCMIEGLSTGAADTDQDGEITLEELYTYIYEEVVKRTPKQTPRKWSYNQEGEFIIARNPRPQPRPVPLPDDLQHSVDDVRPWVREGALLELERWLNSGVPSQIATAQTALQKLTNDDSRRIATAAANLVARFNAAQEAQAAQAQAAAAARLQAEQAARAQEAEAARLKAEQAAQAKAAQEQREHDQQAEAARRQAERDRQAQAERERFARIEAKQAAQAKATQAQAERDRQAQAERERLAHLEANQAAQKKREPESSTSAEGPALRAHQPEANAPVTRPMTRPSATASPGLPEATASTSGNPATLAAVSSPPAAQDGLWLPVSLIALGWAASRGLAQAVFSNDHYPDKLPWLINWGLGGALGGWVLGLVMRRLEPRWGARQTWKTMGAWAAAWLVGYVCVQAFHQFMSDLSLPPDLPDLVLTALVGGLGGWWLALIWRQVRPGLSGAQAASLIRGWGLAWLIGSGAAYLLPAGSSVVVWALGGLIGGGLGGLVTAEVAGRIRIRPDPEPAPPRPRLLAPNFGAILQAGAILALGWALAWLLGPGVYAALDATDALDAIAIVDRLVYWFLISLAGLVGGAFTARALAVLTPPGRPSTGHIVRLWLAVVSFGALTALTLAGLSDELSLKISGGMLLGLCLVMIGALGGYGLARTWATAFGPLPRGATLWLVGGWAAALAAGYIVYSLGQSANWELYVFGWGLGGLVLGSVAAAVTVMALRQAAVKH